jgi:hypothetical protein
MSPQDTDETEKPPDDRDGARYVPHRRHRSAPVRQPNLNTDSQTGGRAMIWLFAVSFSLSVALTVAVAMMQPADDLSQ